MIFYKMSGIEKPISKCGKMIYFLMVSALHMNIVWIQMFHIHSAGICIRELLSMDWQNKAFVFPAFILQKIIAYYLLSVSLPDWPLLNYLKQNLFLLL